MSAWAIVVGINGYPPTPGPLKGAVNDAVDFAEWALDPAGGNVPEANLRFWTYPWPKRIPKGAPGRAVTAATNQWDITRTGSGLPDRKRAPDAREIIKTAEKMGRDAWINAQEGGDAPGRIYVFLAGHGLRAEDVANRIHQTCFVAGDFRPAGANIAEGLVPTKSLRMALLNRRFDEAILFLDCCRNKPPDESMKSVGLCDLSGDPPLAWGTGYAAKEGFVANETRSRRVRGAFSLTLLQGLRGCRDANNVLDLEGLWRHVTRNIGAHTTNPQDPAFEGDTWPPGPTLVTGPPTIELPGHTPGPLVNWVTVPPGTKVRLTKDKLVIDDKLTAGPKPTKIGNLPDGVYMLEVIDNPASYKLFRQPHEKTVTF